MKRKELFVLLCLVLPTILLAQEKTQTITGTVTDKLTKQPIIGASIMINDETKLGSSTDENGNFTIDNVPIGRQTVVCTYVGYQPYVSEALAVSSTKSIFLEIELIESPVDVDEVVVNAGNNVNRPINELSVVSTRSFTADETERIPASINDLNRMALSYPGVTNSSWDVRNEIVIRGNSPFGMSWRLEGIDIPNPNHYANPGTSGGATSIFSAQLLSRSDFSSGGMPAEYGNTLSGTMDVHFRKGDMYNRQHRFRLGVMGIDFATEGPIRKGKSSYLANYRYSTLGLLSRAGFNLIGERVQNDFQDLSFNIAFDGNPKNKFTVFGLGGLSAQYNTPIFDVSQRDETNLSHWRYYTFISNSGTFGGSYTRLIDKKSYLKIGVAYAGSDIFYRSDIVDTVNTRTNYYNEGHKESRITSSITYSRKFNKTTRLKTGVFINNIMNYEFYRVLAPRENVINILFDNTDVSIDGSGSTSYFQYYAQLSKDVNKRLRINAGFHTMYLGLNNTASIEPRLSLAYQLTKKQSLSFSYGLYSKMLPRASYFYTTYDTVGTEINSNLPNQDLPFIKSHHFIGAYQFYTESGLRFTAEAYYQHLFNVPISTDPTNFYWILNSPAYVRQDVVADGKGENIGLDISVEKFFSNKLFFLLTGSINKGYFYPSNGERYETNYSNGFSTNLTLGREFAFKNGAVLQVGGRVLYNGGYRYTPLDAAASLAAGSYVADNSRYNAEQMPNYFRTDARFAYRFNKNKLAGRISLDIQNLLNYQNVSSVGYSADDNELFFFRSHSGLTPILAFTFDF